jgi:hypothetical protein
MVDPSDSNRAIRTGTKIDTAQICVRASRLSILAGERQAA